MDRAEVNEKQRQLITALAQGGAISREELAQRIGKRKLNPSEVKHLEALVEAGYVLKEIEIRGIQEAFNYSLTDTGRAAIEG